MGGKEYPLLFLDFFCLLLLLPSLPKLDSNRKQILRHEITTFQGIDFPFDICGSELLYDHSMQAQIRLFITKFPFFRDAIRIIREKIIGKLV